MHPLGICIHILQLKEEQQALGDLLGGVYHTQLSEYAPNHFEDKVTPLLLNFQQALRENDKAIEVRNKAEAAAWSKDSELQNQLFVRYNTLLQPNIPQSINI
jgi:hypothetical protein